MPVLIRQGREFAHESIQITVDLMLRGNRSARRAARDSAQTAPAPMSAVALDSEMVSRIVASWNQLRV